MSEIPTNATMETLSDLEKSDFLLLANDTTNGNKKEGKDGGEKGEEKSD